MEKGSSMMPRNEESKDSDDPWGVSEIKKEDMDVESEAMLAAACCEVFNGDADKEEGCSAKPIKE